MKLYAVDGLYLPANMNKIWLQKHYGFPILCKYKYYLKLKLTIREIIKN